MPASRTIKTSFASGELAPEMLGRGELRAYENGARRLRNVVLQPTGGVTRRPGLRHVATLAGAARLVPFEHTTEQVFLFVLTNGALSVFAGDVKLTEIAAPWNAAMLDQIAYTQDAESLLLLHPALTPQRVTRNSAGVWSVNAWTLVREPFARFADPAVTLTPSALTGTITVTASAAVFQAGHVGLRLRIARKRIHVTGYSSTTTVTGLVEDALSDTNASTDWDETAFSALRGWPASACYHQARLVLGGSRDLPNRLWLSRTGAAFDFDLGTGLDDEAIEFGLVSDQANAIRGVFSGQHLQVFTSGAEWMVTGEPLTPASIQLTRQTRVGSPVERMVAPVDVDGATIFVARSGQGVYEFAYTQLQQAYQANDLAILARHLVGSPRAMAYDQAARLLHLVMADGALTTLTLYRAEEVTAWTQQKTEGSFHTIAEAGGTIWIVIDRAGSWRLERLDRTLGLDAAISGSAIVPQSTWSGLAHLEGREVAVLADGAPREAAFVIGGAVTLDPPAMTASIGLPFTHEIEPLPPAGGGTTLRLVSVRFRLLETPALSVDVGRGAQPVPFRRLDSVRLDAPLVPFTGDITLRGLGWRRDSLAPLWRVEGDAPLPLTLLSVTTETRTND